MHDIWMETWLLSGHEIDQIRGHSGNYSGKVQLQNAWISKANLKQFKILLKKIINKIEPHLKAQWGVQEENKSI